jgi:hypothetical protein
MFSSMSGAAWVDGLFHLADWASKDADIKKEENHGLNAEKQSIESVCSIKGERSID